MPEDALNQALSISGPITKAGNNRARRTPGNWLPSSRPSGAKLPKQGFSAWATNT